VNNISISTFQDASLVETKPKPVISILHVDDDIGFLSTAKQCLEFNDDFHVDLAISADEAQGKLENTAYEVIISDYEMPKKNGLKFLEELRANSNNTPFILFTGKGREEVAVKALNLGAFRYIDKHGDPETVYTELASGIRQAAEHARARHLVKENEERFKQLFNMMPSGVAVYEAVDDGEDFVLIDFNAAAERIEKTIKSEIIGKRVTEAFPGVKKFGLLNVLQQTFRTGQAKYFPPAEYKDPRCLGSWRENWVYKLPNGNVVALYNDVTKRKLIEEALKESEGQSKAIVMNSPIGIATSDANKHFLSANESFCKILGYTEDELRKLTFIDITHPADITESIANMKDLSSGKTAFFTQEKRYLKKDGTIITGRIIVSAIRHQDGKPRLFIAELEDITERKKMEDKVKQERDTIEAVTQSIGAGFAIISKDYHITWANKFIRQYKGEVEGRICYTALNTLDAPCPDCGVTKIFKGKTNLDAHEYCSTTVDGKPYWVEIIATPIRDSQGNIVAASELAVDITEKKQKEKTLKESKQEFKALFDSNPEAAVYLDENYRFLDVNPRFTEVFGFLPEEVKGKNLLQVIVPEDLQREAKNYMKRSLRENVNFESMRKRKGGSQFNASISIAPVLVEGKRIGIIAVYNDISDAISTQNKLNKSLAETMAVEEHLQMALREAELLNDKLDVIGRFTRHDVRNKLAVIDGNLFLAKKYANDQQKLHIFLEQIQTASKSIMHILDFARNYKKLGSEQKTLVDVGNAVEEASLLITDLKGIEIINKCKGFRVMADSMLTTVFHNLIENSLKYGVKLTKISVVKRENKDGSITIIYQDDGVGISADDKNRLFEKGYGKGTGYGLYLTKRTCEIYGWTVQETGETGKGAHFEFRIP
jgi:PAS domain S-box-containing protein